MCAFLGVKEAVTSPTFSLINEYESSAYGTIYHMDLYRLEKEEDLVQIGLEEYLDSGNLCFIEWPDIAQNKFESKYIRIEIMMGPDNIRIFNITTHDGMDT
jgi:tRNA threonylcarbamoyladenosine biosynthesis protein TsaE